MKKLSLTLVFGLVLSLAVPAAASAFTGGRVENEITLSLAASPYELVRPIEVPRGATLRVEPGVVLNVKHDGIVIKSAGNVVIAGTRELPVVVNNAATLWETAGDFSNKSNLTITHTRAIGIGSIFSQLNQGQNLSISDSVFIGNPKRNSTAMWTWLSFCTECKFERNVFRALPAMRIIEFGNGQAQILNNLFLGNSTTRTSYADLHRNGEWIVSEGSTIVKGNSFIGFKDPIVELHEAKQNWDLNDNFFDGKTAQETSAFVTRDLSNFGALLDRVLAQADPMTPTESSAGNITLRSNFRWKFSGQTLNVSSTNIRVPGDTIYARVAKQERSTYLFSNSSRASLRFDRVSLTGRSTTTLILESDLELGEFRLDTKFSTCTQMWKFFDGGIRESSRSKNVGKSARKTPTTYPRGYQVNASLDRDRDGIVCER
jgi:hypothetical protein